MILNIRTILMLLAMLCFIMAAVRYSPPRVELIALGLALYTLAQIAVAVP